MDSFDELQSRLAAALAANEPVSDIDHVVVVMASYSVGESLLSHYVERLAAMEHRYLLVQLLLNRIYSCDVLFVCSEAPTAEVVDYYGTLVGADAAERMRARVSYVVVPDRSPRSLAAKLLDRPDIMADLRSRIGGRPALIEPWIVTNDEVAVAVALGLPLNGTSPSLRSLAFKSEGRRLFTLARVAVPTGCEDVHDIEEVLGAVDHILARRPMARAVVIKHDDSAAGDGNVVLPVRDAHDRRLSRDEVRDAVTALPPWYLMDLAAGGVVEELVDGDHISSPSVQFDIRPGGDVRVLSTHEQLVGGENGQVFMGCSFPASAAYAPQLARDATAVARELARCGVVGRVGIDFIATRDPTGDWRLAHAGDQPAQGRHHPPVRRLAQPRPRALRRRARTLGQRPRRNRTRLSLDRQRGGPGLDGPGAVVGNRGDPRRRSPVRSRSGHRNRLAHAVLPRDRRPLRRDRRRNDCGARGRAVRHDACRREG